MKLKKCRKNLMISTCACCNIHEYAKTFGKMLLFSFKCKNFLIEFCMLIVDSSMYTLDFFVKASVCKFLVIFKINGPLELES
jgi:hypothetical protein